jgi:phenylalanyl-tRNA synthetase beta chain
MRVPLSWLRQLVDVSVPVPELARRLTMAGLEVEDVHHVGFDWQDVTIARVIELGRHPRRELLNVATVDLGGRTANVVSGAPNLYVGAVVPYVAPGGQLPIGAVGHKDLGGIRSEGMVCSGDELQISPDRDGIYIFEADAPVGTPVAEYLNETVLDVYVGANRPDCMSMMGIAREVHALFGAPYQPGFLRLLAPETASVPGSPGEPPAGDLLSISIEDPVGCPRFTASVVRAIQIGPSPQWLQRRLHFAGVRPISNVVDVTNYVMLEVGQPLHAFDRQRLRSNTIVVRRAHEGERLRTLDGEERTLRSSMMVVTDGQHARSLAGIMGGEDSEIAPETREVIVEGASWDRASIRLTSAALNLSSEASRRFGRGVDPDLTALGVARATSLTLELAGGLAAAGLVDAYPGRAELPTITFTPAQISGLMGMQYSREQVIDTLDALGFRPAARDGAIAVEVPGWRRFDVEAWQDLAEEVGRVVGYEELPATMLRGRVPEPRPEGDAGFSDELKARRTLAAAGLQEVITYSLLDPAYLARFSDEPAIRVTNPQSTELSALRTTLLPSLLVQLRNNLRQRDRVLLFELARTWHGQLPPEPGSLPDERRHIGIVLSGPRAPRHWSDSGFASEPPDLDFFDLKGMVDALCAAFHVSPVYSQSRHASLHPGRTADVSVGEQRLGLLGELHPALAGDLDLEGRPVMVAELDFERLLQARQPYLMAMTPSRFPPADRDIAIVVDEDTIHAEVEAAIREAAQPLLESVQLFDIYRGDQVSAGRKSLAFTLRYRAADRTLSDEEVASAHARVEEILRTRFRGEVRGRT